MDKKKIDDLLEEYVNAHSRDSDKDLAKLHSKQSANYKHALRRINKALVVSIISVIAIIASILAILPLFFNQSEDPDGDNGVNLRYYDNEVVDFASIASIEVFNANNNSAIQSVLSDDESNFWMMIIRETSEVIGLQIELEIWGDKIHNAVLLCYTGEARINSSQFDFLETTATYNGQEVVYRLEIFNEYDYIYYIAFESGDVSYNIIATCYEEMDITELLDGLFE